MVLQVRPRNHETVYGELRGGFGFDGVPTLRFEANSPWQLFGIIAFNLMRAFQAGAVEQRSMNRKRRTIGRSNPSRPRAGLLIKPNGRQILNVGNNPTGRERSQTIENAIAASNFCNIEVTNFNGVTG